MARFNLPDIDYVTADPEELESLGVAKFEELMDVTLNEADPRRKFIQAVAYMGGIISNNIDYTGKQNRLAYAEDNYLDHIGNDKGVPRLEPAYAETTIRYDVNNPEEFIIFAGSRIGINGVAFATKEDRTVPIGSTYVDIVAACTEPGEIGNGFLPGEITELIDPPPWVSAATNITESIGGADWEDNDPYAERIHISPERYSTAGPAGGYEYYAKTAHQNIIDVEVWSPLPARVDIVVLMEGGELPSSEVINQVLEICSDRTIRPLTDQVSVSMPTQKEYSVDVTYYLSEESRRRQTEFQAAVHAAVQDYILWQKSKLGRGIDPGELYARVQGAGGKRVRVEPNEYVELQKTEVAKETAVNVTFGGFIND